MRIAFDEGVGGGRCELWAAASSSSSSSKANGAARDRSRIFMRVI